MSSFFFTQTFESADAAVGARGLELFDGFDAELGVELRNSFGADALQMQQVENRWRELFQQLPVITRVSGFGDLPNLRGEILPDAGNPTELVFVSRARRSVA